MNRDIVPVLAGGFGKINFGKQFRQGNRVYDADAVAMSLMAQPVGNKGGNSYLYAVRGGDTVDAMVKIRKLTPRECFRLMGFTDEEFDRADAVNSNAQLYKQAGNSIVVNVLEHIFRAIYTDDGEMYI